MTIVRRSFNRERSLEDRAMVSSKINKVLKKPRSHFMSFKEHSDNDDSPVALKDMFVDSERMFNNWT